MGPRNCPEYVEIGHNGIREKFKRQGYGHKQLEEAAPKNYESVGFRLYDRKANETESSYTGDYLYYEIVLSKKYYVLEALLVQGRILWMMGKKKVEHVVFDGMRKIKKKVNINQYNTQTKMKIMGQTDKQSVQKHPFPPLYDKDSKVLILGSFPSVKSREMKFFYGHPQNRFWKVIARIFDQENPTSIEEKKKLILDNHLALWDVIAECEISGSSDASIKNAKANDLSEILNNSQIQKIIVNGKTAERLYIKYIEPVTGIKAVVLPSTSPANAAWSLERLVDVWKSEIKN